MVQDKVRDRGALLAVAAGVLAVSSSAILIRLTGAPALAIAFWRCALGVLVLFPVAVLRGERVPAIGTLGIGAISGIALGAHFGTWITSLEYTSVAASVVLVTSSPIFVAILAYLILGEKTSLLSLAGILVSFAGTIVIAGDGTVGSAPLLGNILALLGAMTFAVYVLTGRSLRTGGVSALVYSIIGYSVGAITLLIVAVPSGVKLWGYSWETWFWLCAITLGPQIMGHTVLNWALEYVEASVISGSVLAEPVIAAFLAWIILSEKPGLATILGGLVILFGLYLLLRGRER